MKWYLIDDGAFDGERNMSIDLAMMNIAQKGIPILRLYEWSTPTLSLGKFQDLDEINVDYLKKMGFGLVKRPSGGRAVLHYDELTYAVVAPESMMPKNIMMTYLEISKALIKGLNTIGLNCEIAKEHPKERYTKFAACFATTSLHEITIDNKKFIGSAQTRGNGVLLQHGSIPMKCHFNEYANSFKITQEQVKILVKRLEKTTTCVSEHINVGIEDVKNAVINGFRSVFCAEFVSFYEKIYWKKHVMDVKIWG